MKWYLNKLLQEHNYHYSADNEDCTVSSDWTISKSETDSEEIQEIYRSILEEVSRQAI